ncbi:MAG TPA: DUF5808 domain-containing protein [Isosphaeraceae bacterium]|nr:DUF5808 domain-containing protein [Isosphaeraceae bacterium]
MTTQWFLGPSLVMVFVIGLWLVISYLMPRLTRPDVYFAVTVPAEFRDSVKGCSILKRYRVEVTIFGVLALLIVLAGVRIPEPHYLMVVTLAGLFLYGVGAFLAYYRARGRVMPHAVAPVTVREAALVPREAHLPGGWLLQFPPFALLAATAIWLNQHWGQIPEVFPVHWGANGQPNNWATRSFAGVYGPLLTGAVLCGLMAFLAYAMLRWSRFIRVGGAAGEGERRFRLVVVSILVAAEYLLALTFMWTGLLPLSHQQAGPPGFIPMLAIALAFTVVIVVLMVWVGQGGTRLAGSAAAASGAVAPVGDRTPDKYWKLGLFYVNRNDPALFVEKRFGIGYTLNFGHPGVWVVLAVLLAVFVAIILIVPSHHHP